MKIKIEIEIGKSYEIIFEVWINENRLKKKENFFPI